MLETVAHPETCETCAAKIPLTKANFKADVEEEQVAWVNSLPHEILPEKGAFVKGGVSVFQTAQCGSRIDINFKKLFVRLNQCCAGNMHWPTELQSRNLRLEDFDDKNQFMKAVRTHLCGCNVRCFCGE